MSELALAFRSGGGALVAARSNVRSEALCLALKQNRSVRGKALLGLFGEGSRFVPANAIAVLRLRRVGGYRLVDQIEHCGVVGTEQLRVPINEPGHLVRRALRSLAGAKNAKDSVAFHPILQAWHQCLEHQRAP